MTSSPDRNHAPLESLARQTGFSVDAVAAMRDALVEGGGRMAQFDHREFGGPGQWMQGGLLMISNLSDHALKARIDALCEALSAWIGSAPESFAAAQSFQRQSQTGGGATRVQDSRSTWWPEALGAPDASGTQDGTRYAWFGRARRLVVDDAGRVTTYDTGEHRIGGVAQQQGGRGTMTFTSQHGPVDLATLPVVPSSERHEAAARIRDDVSRAGPSAAPPSADPFAALERLADLHARGIVDDAEFAAKKAELLKRI